MVRPEGRPHFWEDWKGKEMSLRARVTQRVRKLTSHGGVDSPDICEKRYLRKVSGKIGSLAHFVAQRTRAPGRVG